MAKLLFWGAFTCIVYVYLGYPTLLMVWRKLAARPVRKRPQEPTVSMAIVMHNERKNAHAKIQNCSDPHYPARKLKRIVPLDAPTDRTESLVRRYASRG